MEYLQYAHIPDFTLESQTGFKPYYKWNTFNTLLCSTAKVCNLVYVLNLIINGIPSIQRYGVCNEL